MSSESTHFFDHKLYKQALYSFQTGDYESGNQQLHELMEMFPLASELRALNHEMAIKSQIDQQEREDLKAKRRSRMQQLILRGGILVLFVALVVYSIRTYSSWIRDQVQAAQYVIEQQAQQLELSVKYNNARSLIAANRPVEAQELTNQIAAEKPDYPDLDQLQVQIDDLLAVEAEYEQAKKLYDQNDPEALTALRAIQADRPGFKDVPQLIDSLERTSLLSELFTQGNVAYSAADWEEAISAYERIRTIDPGYQASAIESKLFDSYINAGQALLTSPSGGVDEFDMANNYFRAALALRPQDITALEKQAEAQKQYADLQISTYVNEAGLLLKEQGDSLSALQDAETLFREALRIRPNDPELNQQVDLARSYLTAMQEFDKGNWNLVIGNLETVVQQDPEYAVGTARQALYEAYIGRGDSWLAVGDFYSAVKDYEQAAFLAEQSVNSTILLLQAQIKLAEVKGLLGEFEDAVLLYQSVVNELNLNLSDKLDNPTLSRQLANAENYARVRNFSLAYQRYREAMANPADLFEYVEYEVQDGDYLASIANRFNSTIEAIANASRIENPNKILSGQKLVIPSVGEDQPSATPTP